MTPHEKVIAKLKEAGVPYETLAHEPMGKSEEVARLRGVDLHSGAKALVVRGRKTNTPYLLILPADLKLDGTNVKALLGEAVDFAKDVVELTGCVPGSVPPLGSLFNIRTVVDPRLGENERINYNAGSLTDSINMRYDDWIKAEKPEIATIAK